MKIIYKVITFISITCLSSCLSKNSEVVDNSVDTSRVEMDINHARKIFELPTHCLSIEYPNKLGQVIGNEHDLKTPKSLRPIFYGCFDWHSSVHGYWSVVNLLKQFPELDENGEVRNFLNSHITKQNLEVELAFFNDENNLSFERTYGWAWLLKLQQELLEWPDSDAKRWSKILQPLVDVLSERTQVYLSKLVYPIRTGQHDNTAFSLSLMVDYAKSVGDRDLLNSIIVNSDRFFKGDKGCDVRYEPSGYDFLSPCLEEANLMGKIMGQDSYREWVGNFLPQLFDDSKVIFHPAIVNDRSDGKLVHLDGLNFSRAHCFYRISAILPELREKLVPLANEHIQFSLDNISGDDYMGSHWLGTFALLALN